MNNPRFISAISIFFLISQFPTLISAQQPYIGLATTQCQNRDESTSVLGYTCNGVRRTCQAYLTFRAQPPFNSVSTISTLLGANSSQLAQLNSVPETADFQTNTMVLVPVTCSCSGNHYQANVSYSTRSGETYFVVANNTFQSLTTCQALEVQNNIPVTGLLPGARLNIPLRCACPTQNQSDAGVNYLLSYLIARNQDVSTIGAIFGAGTQRTVAANNLSADNNFVIYPFTTLLIPLQDPPTSSQVTAPQPPPPPVAAPPPPVASPPSGGSSKTWIYVVVGVVGVLIIASVFGAIIFFRKKQRKRGETDQLPVNVSSPSEKPLKKEANEDNSESYSYSISQSHDFMESISEIAQSLKVYTFEELKAATEDFSSSSMIKGSVYRGTINGDFAAIKKVNGDVSKEISLLNKINHFNLIRLSGVCFNDGNWYLVYEYASNGSLSDWIHDKSDQRILNWNQRIQVALDVAAGLNYLHRYTSPPHVHKNLHSRNVLLDSDFRAKIADFGMVRSAEGEGGEFALTRHIVGTKGYMAPEYLENGIISPKLDVYAFGVLMLEILTGKEVSLLHEEVNILQLSEIITRENLSNLMDPMLQGKYPLDIGLGLFRMIDDCLKKDPSDRPNMDDIFQSLSRISTSTLPIL